MGQLLPCGGNDDDNNLAQEEKTELLAEEKDPLMELITYHINNPSILKLDATSNNRLLYYSEYGSKTGYPIIHFHGATSSRLEGAYFHESALSNNIRFICIDRPGTGLSTIDRNLTYKSMTNDTKQLIKHLNINEYGLSGISQGASYCLTHLYHLQNVPLFKPRFLCLISGLPPWSLIDDDDDDIVSGDVKLLRNLQLNHPTLYDIYVGFNGWIFSNCFCLVESMIDKAFKKCKSDLDSISKNKKYFLKLLKYSVSGEYGMDGATIQGKNSFKDWGFDINNIDKSVPIFVYHGDDDPVVPIKWVQLFKDKLSQIKLTVFDNYGHLIFMDGTMTTKILNSISEAIDNM